ncbi:hypothetical protein B0J17DRAFT_722648 [Rhizoctonia solani]|nr:hypothetical protein B0J17DRAFT_722648 [Rhizoctonia solani]
MAQLPVQRVAIDSLTSVLSFWLGTSVSSCNPPFAWSMGNGGKGRILISSPLSLDDGWYKEQPCTTFRALQHRKEQKGFKHEFIVLKLLDGSVCRIERMGDPEAPFDAPSPRVSFAHDMAQCFRPDELDQACLDSSNIIAEIELPLDFELMHVLKICRAVQKEEKTRNYTPQIFNCSFLSLAIQVCLTRLVTHWEDQDSIEMWLAQVHDGIAALSDTSQPLPNTSSRNEPVLFRVYRVLFPNRSDSSCGQSLINEIRLELGLSVHSRTIEQYLAYRISNLLWYSIVASSLNQFLEDKIREAVLAILRKKILLVSNDSSDFVKTSSPSVDNLKRESLSLLTNLVATASTSADTTPSPETLSSEGFEKTVDYCSNLRPSSRLNTNARLVVQTRNLAVYWYQWTAYCLSYMGFCLLYTVLVIWGVPLFVPWTNAFFFTKVDDKLERMARDMENSGNIGYSDLEQFAKRLRALSRYKIATWNKNPWAEIRHCVAKHVPVDVFGEIETSKPKIEFYPMGHPRFVALSISAFQNHVLARIESQARETESLWLGSAKNIQAELVDTLSQLWKSIHKDSTVINKEQQKGALSKGWILEVDDEGFL